MWHRFILRNLHHYKLLSRAYSGIVCALITSVKKTPAMTKHFIWLTLFLICLYIPTQCMAQAPKPISIMSEEELALRKWSLNAVSQIMTFNHDDLEERLKTHKDLMTENGCKKYLWILDVFEINEAIERKENVTTSATNKYPLRHTIGRIEIDALNKKRKNKLGYSKNTKIWDIDVPVSIEFAKGLLKQQYRFIASLKVLALSDKIGDYVIIKWTPRFTGKTMNPTHGSTKYKGSRYNTCESIDFINTDHLKK